MAPSSPLVVKMVGMERRQLSWQRGESPPRYLVATSEIIEKPGLARPAQHYRLTFRDIASSTNERTGIFCMIPPGVVFGNTAPCERDPGCRSNATALLLLSVANSFSFDWSIRIKAAAHVNLFILNGCPFPSIDDRIQSFLSHAALRLSCNHAGYADLWAEQVGHAWREPTPHETWPVLGHVDERWRIRAAIDAVVAYAYGLPRSQYEHLLAAFSHASYPKAPFLCLDAFDELQEIGIESFTKKYDPYWDIPLNDNLPHPVIDLALPGKEAASLGPLFDGAAAESIGLAQAPVRASLSTASLPKQNTGSATPSSRSNGAFITIAELLRSRGVITSSDAQQTTGLDAAGVRPHLQQLVQQGLAVTEGQRRGMRYRRVDG